MNEYIVIKERESEAINPIQLVKDETIECIEESDENGDWAGWIYCKGNDKEGWVPKQIVGVKAWAPLNHLRRL